MAKRTGLSLSFCVNDIIHGNVPLAEVERIVASTKCETEADWEAMLQDYCQTYWQYDPAYARELVARFREAGKIDQPRLRGEEATDLSNGWWR